MKQYKYDDLDALQEIVSEDFGDWGSSLRITQEMVDQFAELSGDNYWLHTDPEKCKTMSPFGGTIAHGFLTLILLPKLGTEPQWELTGFNNMLNYGSNKLRFTGVVPVGSEVHARHDEQEPRHHIESALQYIPCSCIRISQRCREAAR